MEKLEYFLRRFCPGKLYNYSTKVRIPKTQIDFRKFLIAKFVLEKGGSAIDGGAHIGYYTRYFSEIIGDRGKVYSFEPNPYIFKLLIKYTKFHGNIISFSKALSNFATSNTFYLEPYSLAQDSSFRRGKTNQKKISIETIPIDDCIPLKEKIALIKLDVEGHEMEVIIGAKKLIAREQPWLIFEYVQNETRNDFEIISLLEKWKYSCLDLQTMNPVSKDRRINLTDIVAIPADFLEIDEIVSTLSLF